MQAQRSACNRRQLSLSAAEQCHEVQQHDCNQKHEPQSTADISGTAKEARPMVTNKLPSARAWPSANRRTSISDAELLTQDKAKKIPQSAASSHDRKVHYPNFEFFFIPESVVISSDDVKLRS
jgi:hypothetical protein